MQAKSRRKGTSRVARGHSRSAEPRTMRGPVQSPPVERLYMQLLVGRKGKPIPPAEAGKRARSEYRRPGENFLLELTTFHIRRRFA
jgi:hypothetical protein